MSNFPTLQRQEIESIAQDEAVKVLNRNYFEQKIKEKTNEIVPIICKQ